MLPLTRRISVRPPNSRIPHPKGHQLDGWAERLQFRSKSTLTTRYYGTGLPFANIKLNAFEVMHSHEKLEEIVSLEKK